MSKADKLKERLFTLPKDFTWDELVKVLAHCGYSELKSGATSARKFCDERMHIINLHKPHPGHCKELCDKICRRRNTEQRKRAGT